MRCMAERGGSAPTQDSSHKAHLVAVLSAHDPAATPTSTTIATAGRFILLSYTTGRRLAPPSPTNSSTAVGRAPAQHCRRHVTWQP
jgi:hypothetical protein